MVTNVGAFGLPQGFVPLAWMYDVPLLVLVGELCERAVVDEGRVMARRVLPITATIVSTINMGVERDPPARSAPRDRRR